MTDSFALTDSILFTGETFVEGQALLVKEDKILDIVSNSKIPPNFRLHPLPHSIIAPAYIDCQVNGGDNVLFNAQPTEKTALKIAAAHRKKGTTSLLPTVITDAPEVTRSAITAIRSAKKQDSSILGIHIEGPHISKLNKGVHDEKYIRELNTDDLDLYRPETKEIILLTLAPETVPPEQIRQITEQGVIVFLGHTAATPEQIRQSLKAEARGFTHLFNGMGPIASRAIGPAGTALDEEQSWASIIADNHHVAPELIRLAVKVKENLFFVSDAMAPAGTDVPAPFNLGERTITPQEDICVDENGTIAGAILTLGEIVPIAIRDIGLDPQRALQMASNLPAQFLGLDDQLGKLLPNFKADIVALDHSFNVQKVWKNGKEVV